MAEQTRGTAEIWAAGIGRKSRAEYGSDLMAEMLRELGIKYIALNPGASYRGLHDSIVNFEGESGPQMILCTHEEIAVAIANGYARVTGEIMATGLHDIVGLQHASMNLFNAWCDRTPIFNLGGGGPLREVVVAPQKVVVGLRMFRRPRRERDRRRASGRDRDDLQG